MKLKFERLHTDGKFAVFIGVFKEKELWFQTLPLKDWHVGLVKTWYDGPIRMLGLGPCEFIWHYPF